MNTNILPRGTMAAYPGPPLSMPAKRSSWATVGAAAASKAEAEALEKAAREERLKKLREKHGLSDREALATEAVCRILKECDGARDVALATERANGLLVLEFPETKSVKLEAMKRIEDVDVALHRDQRYDPVSGVLRVEMIDKDHDPAGSLTDLSSLDGVNNKKTPPKRPCRHAFEELSVSRASELSRRVCERVLSHRAKIPANGSVRTEDSEIAEGRVRWRIALCNVGRLRYSFLRTLEKEHEGHLSDVEMFKDESRHLVLHLRLDIADDDASSSSDAKDAARNGRKRRSPDSDSDADLGDRTEDPKSRNGRSEAKKRRPSSCTVS